MGHFCMLFLCGNDKALKQIEALLVNMQVVKCVLDGDFTPIFGEPEDLEVELAMSGCRLGRQWVSFFVLGDVYIDTVHCSRRSRIRCP